MELSKQLIIEKKSPTGFNAPDTFIFNLPEKVLQFGTGVLLRGLPDYYIDKANKQNVFNGRVVVVKSTGSNVDAFAKQNGLFTHCIKGIVDGEKTEKFIINAAISRVLSANENWYEIMQYAASPEMQVVISNTTEVGIELKTDDDIFAAPPHSFPAKLLAFLYRRFKVFNGNAESGMVIIPTELIVDNGERLKDIVLQLATINHLEDTFLKWLNEANDFCNSLVDRIVPGALKKQEQEIFEQHAGYSDALTIMSEPYSLWAIETASEKTKSILSFQQTDETVIITADIDKYRELKLRLLNATHTFCCALAFMSGFNLVNEAMRDISFNSFIKKLMKDEIAPCITGGNIGTDDAIAFANQVIDRFSNPFIEHRWLSISLNYSAKIKSRCVPLICSYAEKNKQAPTCMAAGIAAFILFMKPVKQSDGIFFTEADNIQYKLDDNNASLFYNTWMDTQDENIVKKILGNESLWGKDLSSITGFAASVEYFFQQFKQNGFRNVIAGLFSDGNSNN